MLHSFSLAEGAIGRVLMDPGRSSSVRGCKWEKLSSDLTEKREELEASMIPPPPWKQVVSFTSTQCFYRDTIFKGHFLLDVVKRWMTRRGDCVLEPVGDPSHKSSLSPSIANHQNRASSWWKGLCAALFFPSGALPGSQAAEVGAFHFLLDGFRATICLA